MQIRRGDQTGETHSVIFFESLQHLALQTVQSLCRGSVALSGGSTYAQLFAHWIALNPSCAHTRFFPVDERCVPFEDPQSNWGTIYRNFLRFVGRERDKEHWVNSVEQFRTLLQSSFATAIPQFDVIFLGVGSDGHTASIFPTSAAFGDLQNIVSAALSPYPPYERITLMPTVIAAARQVITIILGKEKKEMVQHLLRADMALPIVTVLSKRKNSQIYIDSQLVHGR
ncbi:MAG: 6-phosphogluconolactonase [Chitinivibrionales bacterium]|nr:6-phosphogluconolactonase [Chitinivibrionales bacterium]